MKLDTNISIFEFKDEKVKLTEHCELIPFLKRVKVDFPNTYMTVYTYLFYMTHESPKNPYFNYSIFEREFKILEDLELDFDTEHHTVLKALERLKEMYNLPSAKAYHVIAESLNKIASNVINATNIDMDSTSIKAVLTIAKDFKELRNSFDENRRALIQEESKIENRVRGGKELGYDS